MSDGPSGSDEGGRLEALQAYDVLDSAPEQPFEDLAALAAALANAPMAAISFIDAERQWFKATFGLALREAPRGEAFCSRTIESGEPFMVEDAVLDARFATAPLVTGASAVRAYAGAPILTGTGHAVGSVAVFDTRPRSFAAAELGGLRRLARLSVELLEERRHRIQSATLAAQRNDDLRRAHELVVSHLDNTPLAVVEWDETFRVQRWTRSAQAMFGWSSDEVVGKRPEAWQFVFADDVDAVAEIMNELLEGRAPRNVSRNRNHTRDGRVRTCDWYNSVLTLPEGGSSILSIVDDVTDRIELERRSVASQRLESLGHLTGGVAHDFNNLLTVIAGNAGLLESERTTPDRARRLVGMIVEAAERGAALTRSLLAFARRQPLAPTVCDVDALIRGMVPILERTLGETFGFEVRTSGTLPRTATVDAHAFESALLNLVLNARDAQPRGGRVKVSTTIETLGPAEAEGLRATPGPYVVTTVEDAGVGIEDDLQDRVWEPFFTTKPKGEGSGMGLAMVYGFAHQSRGFTRLRSLPGHGTAVALALPWSAAEAEQRRGHQERDPERGSEHVLVVDDNDLVREMVGVQLAALGYRVTTCGDARSALSHLDEDPSIELLLSDVVMPGGMNGFDLALEAKRRRPALAVLLMSGYRGASGADAAPASAHRFDVLEKPYRREVLATRVREALRDVEP